MGNAHAVHEMCISVQKNHGELTAESIMPRRCCGQLVSRWLAMASLSLTRCNHMRADAHARSVLARSEQQPCNMLVQNMVWHINEGGTCTLQHALHGRRRHSVAVSGERNVHAHMLSDRRRHRSTERLPTTQQHLPGPAARCSTVRVRSIEAQLDRGCIHIKTRPRRDAEGVGGGEAEASGCWFLVQG